MSRVASAFRCVAAAAFVTVGLACGDSGSSRNTKSDCTLSQPAITHAATTSIGARRGITAR